MSDTQAIKDKLDIVDFISEYLQLKPAGVNHKGLCPFHHEKTPSFMVSRERQSWHCFGCSKGGDIFTFVQDIEGMEFVEALRLLAERADVPLTFKESNIAEGNQRTRIKDINVAAARFFHNFLLQMPPAKIAREYLKQRGLSEQTIIDWQIGYIPEQWDLLTQYLLKKGFGIDDLVAAGLSIQKQGTQRFYDRFRGRIMFPIWDVHGNVVGFTGRVLVETEHSGGKYVNTPQTAVYDKSRVVFGLNKAKQEIKAKDMIVMVEGQMDVIACHQAGMKNVIATSGTALTEEQIKILQRYSSNLAIAFDADSAGIAASKRGIDLALIGGMNIKVVQIPEGKGKDADECLKKNPEVWFLAVKSAKDVMVWYLERAFAGRDVSQPKIKQAIANEILSEIGRIPYAVERDHWLRELGGRLGVDVSVLREDMTRLKSLERPVRVQHGDTAKTEIEPVRKTRLDLLVERFLALLTLFPAPVSEYIKKLPDIIGVNLSPDQINRLYTFVKSGYNNSAFSLDSLRDQMRGERENAIDVLLMKANLHYSDFDEVKARQEAGELVRQIREEFVQMRREELHRRIAEAERAGDKRSVEELMKELQEVV